MEKSFVATKLGRIAIYSSTTVPAATPVVFLHGVYFDHHLWHNQVNAITDRTIITIDMPWHGESIHNTPRRWTISDCGDMLLEILDHLRINTIIAIGHSWGCLSILNAAHKHPEQFASIGLCNMPFEAASPGKKISFFFKHGALVFKSFYINKAAESLFSKRSLKENPGLRQTLFASMNKLSATQIRLIDKYVIAEAENTAPLIEQLYMPAEALKGKEDYVSTPPKIPTTIVRGGHVSPLEAAPEVTEFCKKIIMNASVAGHKQGDATSHSTTAKQNSCAGMKLKLMTIKPLL
jgi:3-oxoadipate enol-lactonase